MPYPTRDSNGKLPHCTFPEGYPIAYITADYGTLCSVCASSKESIDAEEDCPDDDQWFVVTNHIVERGIMTCDNCSKVIGPG